MATLIKASPSARWSIGRISRSTRLFGTLALAALVVGLTPTTAEAGRRHHGKHHRHYHGGYWGGGPRVSIGFYGGGYPYYSPYYAPYYRPAPIIYSPAPVVYSRPVYVEAPRASVEVDVQRALAKRGYYGGVLDGSVGPQTRAAIRAYQVDKGLPVTGRVDGNLLRSLRLL